MKLFDQKYIQLRLEAMKLNQGSLQQLMTLSATGLALYFGFIGKATFVEAMRTLGVLVVLSWIVALCAAAVAHRLHGSLFLSLCNLSSTIDNVLILESLPDEVQKDSANTVYPEKVVEKAKAKLEAARQSFERESKAFNAVFFPLQERTAFLTTVALSAFVTGFVILGVAYIAWTFSP